MITKSSSPVVVVTSESMEPVYHRGDILFVWNRKEELEVGEVVVAWFSPRELPMVHRVIRRIAQGSVITRGKGKRYVLIISSKKWFSPM